jgi:hypothetical protein
MTVTPRRRAGAVLAVGLGATLISAVGAFAAPWLVVVASALAALVILAQFRSTGPVSVPFKPEDWQPVDDGLVLTIPRSYHGRRVPTAAVWMLSETGSLEEVTCGVSDQRGDLEIAVTAASLSMSLVGEVRIA